MNAAISARAGGKPSKSKYTRRIRVRRSASGAGVRPFSCNFAKTNASIGVRIQCDVIVGAGDFDNGRKDHQTAGSAAKVAVHKATEQKMSRNNRMKSASQRETSS